MARPPPGPGQHPVEMAHRPAVAGCPWAVRPLAYLLQPAAVLAAGRHLANDLDAAGRWRPAGLTRRSRWPARPGCWRRRQWQHLPGLAATPPRPLQHLPHRGCRPPHQPDQQPTRLRGRDSDQVQLGEPEVLAVVAVLRAQPPPAPARPTTPAWSTAAWEHSLTAQRIPATCTSRPGRAGPGRAGPGRSRLQGQLLVGQSPPRQQPEPPAGPAGSGQRDPGPVIDPGTLGAVPGAQPAPGAGGQAGDQLAGWGPRPDPALRPPTAAAWP
jgi:hypothetical protein